MTKVNSNNIVQDLMKINLKDFCEKHYGAKFGRDNKSLCIFHKEKTPSLHYYADKNAIMCYGHCYDSDLYKIKKPQQGKNELSPLLNIFHVVALKEDLRCDGQDFHTIIKKICALEGIVYEVSEKKVDPRVKQLMDTKTHLAKHYVQNIKDKKNETHMVHAYLMNDRGLTAQTIADFFLGLTDYNESKMGKTHTSNRLSIPILNDEGTGVLAISCRQLVGSMSGHKYVHDASDEIWERGKVLYGYSHAKQHAKRLNHLFVVEGYFDMISLYQAGVKNTVAIMSSTITEAQIDKIKTLTDNVTFILDQDQAGLDGFRTRFEMLLNKGINLKVIPNLKFKGKDANDLCITLDWNEIEIRHFLTLCTKDAIQFMLNDTFEIFDESMLKARRGALYAATAVVNLIKDPIQKATMEAYVKERLGL